MNDNDKSADDGWARDILKDVALAAIQEQRRARRWGIFFKLAALVYVTVLLFMASSCRPGGETILRHTAVVAVDGPIADGNPASAELIIESLQAAFEAEQVAGVVLKINSPGGSPVQAGMVNDEIRRLRGLHPDIPVYAVVSDLCASGAYYIAVAADRIYVDKASLVGSIGVLMSGFGFTGTMEKLGVERRLYTAGQSKGFMDPFAPVEPGDVAHVDKMLEAIHHQFIDVVKQGRGDRLLGGDELFSGLVWTGEQSVELGLADALGDVRGVARDVIGAEHLIDYTVSGDVLSRFAQRFGASAAREIGVQLRGLQLR